MSSARTTVPQSRIDIAALVHGRTFDDFLFRPQHSVVDRRDPRRIDLSTRFSEHVPLQRPLVSANMDTVTRAAMAIALAEEGGIGVVDRGFRNGDIEPQVREVTTVKRTRHDVIAEPYTIGPDALLSEAAVRMRQSGVGTLVVVDAERHLVGMLTDRDLRFTGEDAEAKVRDRMTPGAQLVVQRAPADVVMGERLMREHKVKKLPIVDANGVLQGLLTARDLLSQREHPFATRDPQGRLRVAAAIGARGDYLERADELIRAGADVIVIDIAHGHSTVMAVAIEAFRRRFGDFELVAGNVATAEGVRFLMERDVNAIKVGIGPGGGCTTRLHTNFGVPQAEALVECRLAAGDGVPLIADGGVRRDGALVQALMFGGDTVMLGSAFAGTAETPGELVSKPVLLPESNRTARVPFKVFRGMASLEAIVDRLDVEDAEAADIEALGAEGLEVSVPARGSVRMVIADMLKHLCSAISYGGATGLQDLKQRFWADPGGYVIPLSEASRRESFER
jgi:IMP dehydrogenase